MSLKNGVWHDAELDPPRADYHGKPLLAVREIGKGSEGYRKYDIVTFYAYLLHAPSCIWDGKYSKSGVIYWMPLPEIPKDGD